MNKFFVLVSFVAVLFSCAASSYYDEYNDEYLDYEYQNHEDCRRPPPTIKNGNYLTTQGLTRFFKCDNGYYLYGLSYTTCIDPRRNIWSTPGQCLNMWCATIPFVQGGLVSAGTSEIGARRDVTCITAVKRFKAVCADNGQWEYFGTCTAVPAERFCGDVSIVPNGFVEEGPSAIGSVRRVACYSGYLVGSLGYIHCTELGQWSYAGFCIGGEVYRPDRCRLEPFVENGYVYSYNKSQVALIGTIRYFGCNDYYFVDGNNQINCTDNGYWQLLGKCKRLNGLLAGSGCLDAPLISNALVGNGSNKQGAIRKVVCLDNSVPRDGPDWIMCLDNGQWSQPGVCFRPPVQECRPLPDVPHGYFRIGNFVIGSRRYLMCETGYQREGEEWIVCLPEGIWSDPGRCRSTLTTTTTMAAIKALMPEVFPACRDLPIVTNGAISNGGCQLGSVRRVICQQGYVVIGPQTIKCLFGGWSFPGYCSSTLLE